MSEIHYTQCRLCGEHEDLDKMDMFAQHGVGGFWHCKPCERKWLKPMRARSKKAQIKAYAKIKKHLRDTLRI